MYAKAKEKFLNKFSKKSKVTNIKRGDEIFHMDYEEFVKRFPIDEGESLLGEGTYGKVYSSGKYAVKVFKRDIDIKELILELDIYSSNRHPCILTPKAWSIKNHKGYLAMKRGENIKDAFLLGQISIERIILDTLSAINFLNSKGIAHRDIKPDNMVFHKGRCKIIDMGLAKKCHMNYDGEYYVEGLADTINYKDPEYFPNQYNNIKFEIYSLAASYVDILTGEVGFGILYTYRPTNPKIDWFVEQAKLFWDERPNINTLLEEAQNRYNKIADLGTTFQESKISPLCSEKKNFDKLTMWVLDLAYQEDYSAEALFLCLHLIHRTYPKILAKYKNLESIINLYGIATLQLSLLVTTGDKKYNSFYWYEFRGNVSTTEYYLTYPSMLENVIIASRGIISTLTYWDYAKSSEDLSPLLRDIMACDYKPRIIKGDTDNISNKCVTTREFINPENLKFLSQDVKKEELTKINSCLIYVESDLSQVKKIWTADSFSPYDLISVLFRNRNLLYKLKLEIAEKIYRILILLSSSNLVYDFLLNTICPFNWKKRTLPPGTHPFRAISEESLQTKKDVVPRKKILNYSSSSEESSD